MWINFIIVIETLRWKGIKPSLCRRVAFLSGSLYRVFVVVVVGAAAAVVVVVVFVFVDIAIAVFSWFLAVHASGA